MTRTRFGHAATLAAALGLGTLAIGCATAPTEEVSTQDLLENQQYALTYVKVRADELKPGMSRVETLMLLGTPAEYRGDTWAYLGDPEDGTTHQTLLVRFRGDRYLSHELTE